MPRWTAITKDDLKAAGHGGIMDRAQTTAVGIVDPIAEEIANAVARVRRAVAVGNPVDSDMAKVPLSLKALTVRIVLFALMERIGLALSEDRRDTRKNDNSDLLRISDRKTLIEAPDDTDAASSPPNLGNWNSENKIVMRTHPVPRPGTQFSPPPNRYANPDAPEDEGNDA